MSPYPPPAFSPPQARDVIDPESGSDRSETNHEEIEIDETSDGEDERRAHEILRAPVQTGTIGGNSPISLPYDNHDFAVRLFFGLQAMRSFTGSPISQELSSDQSVLRQHHLRNRTPKAPVHLPQISLAPPQSIPAPLSTPSQPASERRPTLDTYPPSWREVISNAKKTYRVYLAGTNGFPDSPEAVQEACECLADALAVHREEGKTVEASEHYSRWSDEIHYSFITNQHTVSAGTWQCL